MKGLLHIGMPKTMSKSIQDMFINDSSEKNFYLGKGPTDAVPSQVQYVLETELLQIPSYHYNSEVVGTVFQLGIESAKEQCADTFIVSDENIVTPMGDGYESHLQRLKAVMPEDTIVLLVIREQVAFMKSFYKHRVGLEGMTIDFDNFLKYHALRGSKSILGLMDHINLVALASKYFPKIEIITFEEVKRNPRAIHERMAAHGIEITADLPKVNEGLSHAEAYHVQKLLHRRALRLNIDFDLVLGPDDLTTMQANRPMFDDLLMMEKLRVDTIIDVVKSGKILAETHPDVSLDYSIGEDTQNLIFPFFRQVNQRMVDIMGLPLADYGYLLPEAEEAGESLNS